MVRKKKYVSLTTVSIFILFTLVIIIGFSVVFYLNEITKKNVKNLDDNSKSNKNIVNVVKK